MKISPSVLAANLIDLGRILGELDSQSVDLIHMDVMDGNFVPTLSFGEVYCAEVRKATDIPLDVHLMVAHPEREIPKYFGLRPENITFHLETTSFPVRLAQSIRAEGIRAGLAINPGTPIELIEPCLDEIDLVLVMSVEPGYYGQAFIPATFRKLRRLRGLIQGRGIQVEVDGGIGLQNIGQLAEEGVDICVAGSSCFGTGSPSENARALKVAAAASARRLQR